MSWAKPSDAAAEAAVWGLLEQEAKARKDAARAWLTERMGPDLLAVKAIANGQDVGRASYVEGKAKFKVTDPDAFRDFVATHYPTEIVTAVSPAFQTKLMGELTRCNGLVIDPNGVPVAGVELVEGNPYVSVTKSKDAREKVAALMAQGRVSLDGIRAIEGAQ